MSTRLSLRCRGHRIQEDDAGNEDDRQRRCLPSRCASRPMPPIPPGSPCRARKASRRSSSVRLGGAHERQAVPRWSDDQIDRSRARSEIDKPAGIGERHRRWASSQSRKRPAIVEPAEVDTHRARIDPHDPRHRRSGLLLLGYQRPRHVRDRLGVQHQVVPGEEPGDARLVQLGLEVADAERAEDRDALALLRRRR